MNLSIVCVPSKFDKRFPFTYYTHSTRIFAQDGILQLPRSILRLLNTTTARLLFSRAAVSLWCYAAVHTARKKAKLGENAGCLQLFGSRRGGGLRSAVHSTGCPVGHWVASSPVKGSKQLSVGTERERRHVRLNGSTSNVPASFLCVES